MIKLDKKDLRILDELYLDGRASISEIAKKVDVSKELANYRIKRMENEGFLLKINPIIDLSKIGFQMYRLLIKFNNLQDVNFSNLIFELKKYKEISWIVKLQGEWDLVLIFNLKNNYDFKNIYKELMLKYHDIIEDKYFSIVSNMKSFSFGYLTQTNKIYLEIGNSKEIYKLSDIEKKILEMLSDNGKISLVQMAIQLNSSVNVVKYNLKKLEENKIILGYFPILDIGKIGYEHFKILLSLESIKDLKNLMKILMISPNVIYITEAIGRFDIEFECNFRQMKELLEFLSEIKKLIEIKEQEIIYENKEILINEVDF